MTVLDPVSLKILDAMPQGALVAEVDSGFFIHANPVLLTWLGVSGKDLERMSFDEILQLPPTHRFGLIEIHVTADLKLDETTLTHGDSGETRKCLIQVVDLPDNKRLFLLTRAETSTGEKGDENLSEDDGKISKAHADFISVVSHEFRTPLTSIKGFADTLLRYGKQLPEDQQRRFVAIIKDQADRLTRLVENLLTVSKLGASKMDMSLRPLSVFPILEKVKQTVESKGSQDKHYAGKPIILDVPETIPEVWADSDKFEQVVLNLTDNAVKYAFADKEVSVKVSLKPANPEVIRMAFTNHGIGIPLEHLPQIFNRFSRIDNPLTREVEGTGLGLYITKSLIQAMGGEIGVESTPNETTTFFIELPVATPERQAAYRRTQFNIDEGGSHIPANEGLPGPSADPSPSGEEH